MLNTSNAETYDFAGMATVYDVECGDGRVISKGAFDHQDGYKVPLVWRHGHDEMTNVLGHGYLKSVPGGMKFDKVVFNDTDQGQHAKKLVHAKSLDRLSIYATRLTSVGRNVKKGYIQEVSLVLAGHNPDAVITEVIKHSDDPFEENSMFDGGIVVYPAEHIELYHGVVEEPAKVEDSETVGDILASLSEEQIGALGVIVHYALGGDELPQSEEEGSSLGDVYNSLTDKQKDVVGLFIKEVQAQTNTAEHSALGETIMTQKTNVFETAEGQKEVTTVNRWTRGDLNDLIHDAFVGKKSSLKSVFQEAASDVLAHDGTYGIDNIELLFPDAQMVGDKPFLFHTDDMKWVVAVLDKAKKLPFMRIKSMHADITAKEARAKGYIKANEKFEEVFPLFARETNGQMIYKKQKLDRTDIIQIKNFDIVVWLKNEMKMMLRYELAMAILVGDGRDIIEPDKIFPDKIRPIWGEHELYAPVLKLNAGLDVLDIIDAITIAALTEYKGLGEPTLFITKTLLALMLTVRDGEYRRVYATISDLALAMNVGNIVPVDVMANKTRVNDEDETVQLEAILINMADYCIGMESGGETTFFDDFDINFNQYLYLYETMCSGAMVTPKSAVVVESIVPQE